MNQATLFDCSDEHPKKAVVVNITRKRKKTPYYDVYIGRKPRWSVYATIDGQPYKESIFYNYWSTPDDGDQHEVCEKYRKWLMGEAYTNFEQERRANILFILPYLKGCVLGCWCKPEECHGDLLCALINGDLPYPEDWEELKAKYIPEDVIDKFFHVGGCGRGLVGVFVGVFR